jgi:pimeloyl-ACP methyl ester carboxylesterase
MLDETAAHPPPGRDAMSTRIKAGQANGVDAGVFNGSKAAIKADRPTLRLDFLHRVPTLILHGDADRILPPDATSRRQAKMIKDVKLSFLG